MNKLKTTGKILGTLAAVGAIAWATKQHTDGQVEEFLSRQESPVVVKDTLLFGHKPVEKRINADGVHRLYDFNQDGKIDGSLWMGYTTGAYKITLSRDWVNENHRFGLVDQECLENTVN